MAAFPPGSGCWQTGRPVDKCREAFNFLSPFNSITMELARHLADRLRERGFPSVADTKKIEDKAERKKVKRAARKKAAPKAKRTTPRGSNKKKVKKMARGQSKR